MKMIIERYCSKKPVTHQAKVRILIDEKEIVNTDNRQYEFVSEAESANITTADTAKLIAKALNCEVEEKWINIT